MGSRWTAAAACAGVLALSLLMGGCATGPAIDTRYSASAQASRIDLLVIHYTALDFPTSLRVLTQQSVSSHYLVDEDPPTIYRLVEEGRRAMHAGASAWSGRQMVNTSSIGIEIVNRGYVVTPEGPRFHPYPEPQIQAVIALVRDIVKRHGIPPHRVVGHSDVAPGRKSDPGPLFPWKRLADEGLALWFDETRAAALRPGYEQELPPLPWFQQRLAKLGYLVPLHGEADRATGDVMRAFQMRFRPSRHDGQPDAETAAILAALTSP